MTILKRTFNKILVLIPVSSILIMSISLLSLSTSAAENQAVPLVQVTLPSVADTYVLTGAPNVDQGRGDRKTLWAGNGEGEFGIQRTLMKFAQPSIPVGSQIDSALLTLVVAASTGTNASVNVTVQRITNNWTEAVTQNTLAISNASGTPATVGVSKQEQTVTWDVTSLLQAWLADSTTTDISFMITGDESPGVHERAFWSKDCQPDCSGGMPSLEINFIEPTPAPTPTPTSTPNPASTINLTVNAAITPSTGTVVLPNEPVDITLKAQNGPVAVTNVVLTSNIPTGFTIVGNSENGTVSGSTIRWEIPSLAADAPLVRTYRLTLSTTETLSFTAGKPPTSAGYNETIPFEITPKPVGSDYCYRWDFGDGVQIMDTWDNSAMVHLYSSPGTYTVRVSVSKSPDYFATASTSILITDNNKGNSPAPEDNSECQLSEFSRQNVQITSGATWTQGGQAKSTSASILLKPSNILFLPVMDSGG